MQYANRASYKFKVSPILDGDIDKLDINSVNNLEGYNKDTFIKLRGKCDLYINKIIDLMTYGKDNKPTKHLSVKYDWFKRYQVSAYHHYLKPKTGTLNPPKYYPLDYKNIFGVILNGDDEIQNHNTIVGADWILRNRKILSNLERCNNSQKEGKAKIAQYDNYLTGRNSDFLHLIYELNSRINFGAFINLFTNDYLINNYPTINKDYPQQTYKIKQQLIHDLKSLSKQINELSELLIEQLTPNTTLGAKQFRSSFNYYTIRKQPKIYDEIIEKKKSELNNCITLKEYEKNDLSKVGFEEYLAKKYKSINELNLPTLYKYLKEFKAVKKSEFLNYIDSTESPIVDSKEFRADFSMFACDQIKLDKFVNNSIEIKNLSNQKNQLKQQGKNNYDYEASLKKIENRLTFVREERAGFFNYKSKTTQNYKNVNDIFKRIAMDYGKIKAEIRSIEKQIIESNMTSHWSILAHNNKTKVNEVWFFDLNNPDKELSKIHSTITKERIEEDNPTHTLKNLHSITYRGMDKLFFKEADVKTRYTTDKTMINDLDFEKLSEDTILSNKQSIKDYLKFNLSLKQRMDNPKLYIEFYQTLLAQDYINNILGLSKYGKLFEEKVIKGSFEKFEDFQKALEFYGYVWVSVNSQKVVDEVSNFAIKYSIDNPSDTGLDFGRTREIKDNNIVVYNRDKRQFEKDYKPTSNTKFFENVRTSTNTVTRLNPEATLYRRNQLEPNERNNLGNNINQYRFNQSQYTLQFGALENANQYNFENNFKTKDELQRLSDISNNDFWNSPANKDKTAFDYNYIGIDTGQGDLLSLCIVKYSDRSYKIPFYKDKSNVAAEIRTQYLPNPVPIEVLSIREGGIVKNISKDLQNPKIVNIYQNPSLFMTTAEEIAKYFEVKSIYYFDLSMAKIIKGHIVLEGDVFTYMNNVISGLIYNLYQDLNQYEFDSSSIKNVFYDIDVSKIRYITSDGIINDFSNSSLIQKLKLGKTITDKLPTELKSKFEKKLIDQLNQALEAFQTNKQDPIYKVSPLESKRLMLKVNRYKKNLIANYTGIISHLKSILKIIQNEECLICLENQPIVIGSEKKDKFQIPQSLEIALLDKLKKDPSLDILPQYKQYLFSKIKFQEDNGQYDSKAFEQHHVGPVIIIDTFETSKRCPICDEKISDRGHNKFHNVKYCSFNLESEKEIHERKDDFTTEIANSLRVMEPTPDAQATLNIAKLGFGFVMDKRQKIKPNLP